MGQPNGILKNLAEIVGVFGDVDKRYLREAVWRVNMPHLKCLYRSQLGLHLGSVVAEL
jgi:hypothetical protein